MRRPTTAWERAGYRVGRLARHAVDAAYLLAGCQGVAVLVSDYEPSEASVGVVFIAAALGWFWEIEVSRPPSWPTWDPTWGEWMRAEREARGLTRPAVAVRLGVTESSVEKWESGRRCPMARSFLGWARALGVAPFEAIEAMVAGRPLARGRSCEAPACRAPVPRASLPARRYCSDYCRRKAYDVRSGRRPRLAAAS